jgi:hypothetical protein
MESAGIYWVPLWRVLECDFDVKPVNSFYTGASDTGITVIQSAMRIIAEIGVDMKTFCRVGPG